MSSLGNRAAILTLSRLANYGLMLISPVVLVRLMSVVDFGRYREFLLYASLLQSVAMFSINDSLLYFIPAHPRSPWRIARQTTLLMLASSCLVVAALALADRLVPGGLVRGHLGALVAYTLLAVNLDHWEFYWLAQGRPLAVFAYSGVRLGARVAVAIGAAAVSGAVDAIIAALIALEGLRLVIALVCFRAWDRSAHEPPVPGGWRGQLAFCVPSGLASLLAMLTRNLSSVVVARILGPAALAQYAIGRFGEPLVVTVRNSLSSVVLPEMVRKDRARGAPLALWRKATTVNAIFLLPVVVFVARYAEPLVTFAFGARYREAAVVLQIYLLVVVRECFDFAPALRAANSTRPLVASNVAALLAGAAALALLLPTWHLAGAMLAVALAAWIDCLWLAWQTHRLYAVGLRELVDWRSLGATAGAALLAGTVLLSDFWTREFGRAGMVPAACAFVPAYAVLLSVLRVREYGVIVSWMGRLFNGRPAPHRG